MKYICNPINVSYRYQFNADPRKGGELQICREAADPSMILFKGRYYIFASMTLGVWVSDDLAHWESYRLPEGLPFYDYAPDVRVIGDYVYFCASAREHSCDRWRTKDVLNGPYERMEGSFPFWDPNLFLDDDGRVYFYWGCSNETPIYGVELDPVTMLPRSEAVAVVEGHPFEIGYERVGEDNSTLPASAEEVEARYQAYLKSRNMTESMVPENLRPLIRGMFSNKPYIEGAWMDKHCGKYYLQYAAPGTQYNTYSDGVYVGEGPLGPFRLAENNPYSYKPGGFLPGAGHGSTMRDKNGGFWHTATMRISVNHDFERRVGLWSAGFDNDGELFCNQRYGDWPMALEGDPWRDPAWMLLSVGKAVTASSFVPGHEPSMATEENVQTWWRAAGNSRNEWLCVDLGKQFKVHAVQINFADDRIDTPCPGEIRPGSQARYIDEAERITQWKLEGSVDGEKWFVIEDKSDTETDLSHDLIIREEGIDVRYLRLSDMAVPFEQAPCVSGLRVFGLGDGEKPAEPVFSAARTGDLDMAVQIKEQKDALGYNILFGSSPEKLYHSYMIFKAGSQRVGALIKGREYYVRVDAFNENGITRGKCVKL
ncbi:MAG: family 43 glycosylhydrolase [Gemmiger sp.]|uniref:family 43 glycosylhydrolase n=1 Tax=Gemmiger sp. TaxID=2049027 RepID=UPI002A820B50|nr:family 43 glycosylhydrolase [Gemmiger sp.]MDY4880097.1 family 43 glycosylhydrolase [Gemmiger sp.]